MVVYDFEDLDTEQRLWAEAEARRARYNAVFEAATPELAEAALGLTRAYPHLRAGAVQTLALGGITADSPVAFTAANLAAKADARDGTALIGQEVEPGLVGRLWDKVVEYSPLNSDGVKAAVRGVLTFFDGARHELISRPINALHASDPDHYGPNAMSLGEAYEAAGDSALFRALNALIDGEEVDLGSGFMPGGKTQEAHVKQAHALKMPNSNLHVTPGRALLQATTPIEPGQRGFEALAGAIDFGLATFADPAAVGLKSASLARKAERTFGARGMSVADQLRSAGGVRASRKTTVAENVDAFVDTSPVAKRIFEWTAGESDFTTIWTNLGRSRVGREVARELADESDPAAIAEIYRRAWKTNPVKPTATLASKVGGVALATATAPMRALGGARVSADSAVRAGEMFGVGAAFRQSFAGTRAMQMMPKHSLDPRDMDGAQEQLDRFMRTAKLSDERLRQYHRQFADISSGDPGKALKMREVVRNILAETDLRLTQRGIHSEFRKAIDKVNGGEFAEDLRLYNQEAGESILFEGSRARLTGDPLSPTKKAIPTAQLLTEYSSIVPLPDDMTEFRRATGHLAKIWQSESIPARFGKGLVFAGAALQRGWSTAMLFGRVAWTLRVSLEAHLRMAADGLANAFSNPISWIAWSFGKRGNIDAAGDAIDLAKQFHAAAGKRGGLAGLIGAQRKAQVWHPIHKPTTGGAAKARFIKSWAGDMEQLWHDEIVQRVAGGLRAGDTLGGKVATGNAADDVTNWLFHGNGRQNLEELATNPDKAHFLTDPEAVRRYVVGGTAPDGTELKGLTHRINYYTGGNQRLIDAIGKGDLDGINVHGMPRRKQVYSTLAKYMDDAPETVKGVKSFSKGFQTRFIDRVFEIMFTLPDNILNRFPTYKQNYWRRIRETIDLADAPTQQAILANAKKAKLPKADIRDMEARIKAGASGEFDDVAQLDLLAKDHALDETRKLLYDVTERSNFAEGTKLVTAFAEAWKEIGQTWLRLSAENPHVTRRAQQVVQSAREQGFLYPDPQTGEERFGYYGGGNVATALLRAVGMPEDQSAALGAVLKMEGSARSLNIFSSTVIPGLGPISTMALGEFLPDKPEYKEIRELLMPVGYQEVDGAGGALDHLMPAWLKKLQSGVLGDRNGVDDGTWMSTVGDMSDYLVANGNYIDESGMLDQQRLADDSKRLGKWLLILRGIAQSVLPSAPSFEVYLDKKDGGEQIHYYTLGQELGKLQDVHGFKEGTNQFIKTFGIEALMATTPRSQAIRKRALSVPGAEWEKSNPDILNDHPDVAGFFAPTTADPEGDFDITAWGSAVEAGDIVRVSAEQRVALHNRMVAFWKLDQAEKIAAAHPDKAQADAFMSQVRNALNADYPGVFERVGVAAGMTPQAKLGAVIKAVQDPRLAATDAGVALKKYLAAREMAQAQVATYSSTAKGYADAKATRPLRDWLRAIGEALVQDHPDFAPMWQEVLLREGRMSPDKEYEDTVPTMTEVAA